MFATTLTEKLMTFALGRGVDYRDAPAVRAIVREAASRRLSVFVDRGAGIVRSTPFRMRSSRLRTDMHITKMALPRRTFLRGLGATVALPLLDAMVPALASVDGHRGAAGPAPRLCLHPDGHEPGAMDTSEQKDASPSCR